MNEETRLVRELIREKAAQKVFAKVFDQPTVETLHALARKGLFEQLEFVIKTGKEGHVFRAVDKSGNYRAVKIYKVLVQDFKKLAPYLTGDPRFAGVKRERAALVHAWVQKEYKNLRLLQKAGVRVPTPLGCKNNVLVMEFIGENGEASLPVKNNPPADPAAFHAFVQDALKKMLKKAKLVHADFSEYNILNNNQEFVVIDVGQGVLLSHPRARELLQRDIRNSARYLQHLGVTTGETELLAELA